MNKVAIVAVWPTSVTNNRQPLGPYRDMAINSVTVGAYATTHHIIPPGLATRLILYTLSIIMIAVCVMTHDVLCVRGPANEASLFSTFTWSP